MDISIPASALAGTRHNRTKFGWVGTQNNMIISIFNVFLLREASNETQAEEKTFFESVSKYSRLVPSSALSANDGECGSTHSL